ncbi:MAG: NADH-quinone oxidoreductase subunit NuoG [Acidimicrobiales bacterium]
MPEAPKPIVVDTPVTLTVNGETVTAQKGELLIDACERAGTYIPRFCYHPRMNPVGMCRMCLVEVDTGRGPALQPSCMLECGDGMSVDTQSDKVRKAQDGVLEFLLINHPLDCPVCDKGGECPLQDTTMSFGPGESRWVEEKRHYRKPIPISETVNLDRERCILCDRCTRFADEVVGDPLIHFMERGANTQVNTFPGEPFSSYFSGNTVQICPVGALTATPYRFKARPWDLEEVESTCTGCSVGCRITVQSSRDEVLRYNGIDADAVNWSWLCDKGRFGFEAVNSEDRLVEPLVRSGSSLAPARWNDALDTAARLIKEGLDRSGPAGFAVLGGARLTNESAYAWAKLVKGVIGSDNADAQLADGLPADVVLGLPHATIADACRPGGTVILLGPDPKEELGVLYIRLKHAIVEDGATLIEITPQRTGLSRYAAASLTYRPGEAAAVVSALVSGSPVTDAVGGIDADELKRVAGLVAAADGPVTVVLGRASVAESAATVVDAAALLLEHLPGVTFLSALRRGNVHGALDLGLAPGLLPGRVRRSDAAGWFGEAWPTVPAADGLDAAGILQAAADGKIDTLVLLGADPLADFVDRELATRALTGARSVIALDQFLNESSQRADVVFPAAGFAEVSGTTTNLEGRVSLVAQKVTPAGSSRADWAVAADLSVRLGTDLGLEGPEAIWAEIEELSVTHAGVTLAALAANATEGIVVPLPPPASVPPISTETGESGAQNEEEEAGEAAEGEGAVAAEAAEGEAPEGDVAEVEETGPEMIAAPEPLVFAAPAPTNVPAVDAYALRLVAPRTMYDAGTLLQHARSSAQLAPAATLRLHPADFDRAGVGDDGRVKITAGSRSLVVEATVDASLPRGTASLAATAANVSAHELIDIGAAVTDIRLEAAR